MKLVTYIKLKLLFANHFFLLWKTVIKIHFIPFSASLFGDVFLRPETLYLPSSPQTGRSVRSIAKEEEMKRAAFVYHFLSNEIDDV